MEAYEMRFHRCQSTVTLLREELRQTKAALRNLVEQAKAKEWDNRFGDSRGFYHVCSQCNLIGYEQHYPNCPYAAAIAEAERLLESEGK